jgi:branched-chain amino acid transport system substrate-binding protein
MKVRQTRVPLAAAGWAVALAITLAACGGGGGDDKGGSATKQVVVGMLQPLTGDAAAVGQTGRQGAELAVSEVNAKGGVDGTTIKLEVLDAAGDVTTGTNAFTKLMADKPVAILGPNISAVALALVPRLDRARLPMLSGALSPDLTKSKSPWVFRIRSSDSTAARDLVDYAAKTLNLSSIALVSEESDYGQGGAAAVEASLEAEGIKPVTTATFAAGANDLSSQVLKIKKSGAKSVIYWGSQSPAALFAKQARQLGYSGTILGSNAYTDASVLKLAGTSANGIYSVVNFIPQGTDPAVQQFVKAYKAKYGNDPDSYAASYFDTVNLLVQAMQSGTSAEDIADTLKSVNYTGIAATYKYHDDGEMAGEQQITQVRDGAPAVVQSGM